MDLQLSVVSSIEEVGAGEWDACATGDSGGSEVNPFVLHAFLASLEVSGSAARDTGWLPQHALVRRGDTGELLGCCPMYLKGHSMGEYVFDHAWANAYERVRGQGYYPKLLVGVPFSPVPGPRLLVKAPAGDGPSPTAVRRGLGDALRQVARQFGVSSLHINFCSQEEVDILCGSGSDSGGSSSAGGFMHRTGIQYHWENRGYTSFDGGEASSFLSALRQSRRKSIRQDRKKAAAVAAQGLHYRRLVGEEISDRHWDSFYSCCE